MRVEPLLQRAEIGKGEAALEIGPDARNVAEIAGLAVAVVQPGEDAEDLGRALGPHHRIGGGEGAHVESGVRLAARLDVAAEQSEFQVLGHIDPRILRQRDEVIGGRPHHRVLEVQQADLLQPVALGHPDQVGRMIVAQHPHRLLRQRGRQRLRPQAAEGRARQRRHGRHAAMRQVPVEQQLGLDQQRVDIVAGKAVVDLRRHGQRVRQVEFVQSRQHIRGDLVALGDRRARVLRQHAFLAEVLHDEQARVEVGGIDGGRGKTARLQAPRQRHERLHVLGDMGDGAVGLAIAHRRPVRTARRIHQHRVAARADQPLIGAGRGIALQMLPARRAEAGDVDERADRLHALQRERKPAIGEQAHAPARLRRLGRDGDAHFQPVGLQHALAGTLGPFHQRDGTVRLVGPAEFVQL